jgi:hypothetical protein
VADPLRTGVEESVTVNVTVREPDAVGVPLNVMVAPLGANESPLPMSGVGVHVYGAVPPLTVNV